jgi:hypothetical protein
MGRTMTFLRATLTTAASGLLALSPLGVATTAHADSTTAKVGFGQLFHNGSVVRTVATPTSQPGRGVDAIYPVSGGVVGQLAVTSAAPGDNYHGGRWAVHLVTWNTSPYLLTSDEAVAGELAAGDISITRLPAADFVCPVAGS